jgi:hypothetical protein
VQGEDVRVAERDHRSRLTLETVHPFGIDRVFGGEHLQGDVAPEPGVTAR